MAAAAATMALKATLKGEAYGWEEMGVDAAVGAVDALVTVATAGIGKGVVAALEKAIMAQMAKAAAKQGGTSATKAAMKAWAKEALEEAIENAVQGMPSAFVEALLNDNTWKSDDPWGEIGKSTAGAAGMGAAMGVGMKGAGDLAGAAKKGLGGSGPKVDVDAPGGGAGSKAGGGAPPEPKPLDLPPEATPAGAADKAAAGELPPGAEGVDATKGGELPDSTVPDSLKGKGGADADAAAKADADADATAKGGADTEAGSTAKGADADADAKAKADADAKANADAEAKAKADAEGAGAATTKADGETKTLGQDAPEGPAGKGGPSEADVGRTLSPEELADRYGMPRENVDRINKVCSDMDIIVDVRPTTPYAEPMLRDGTALPKPEKLKAKTINDVDVMIGLASKDDLGKVGIFDPAKKKPVKPDNYAELDPATREKIDKRIKQREEEFNDYGSDIKKLQDAGLVRIDENGVVINTGLVDGKELPFTGDHDVFDIRAKDGTQLTPEQYAKAKAALQNADAGVMHGAVTGWEMDSPETFHTEAGQKSYKKMVDAHTAGGEEPLVRFGDGEPKGVWYEPSTPRTGTPDADAPGIGPDTGAPSTKTGAGPEPDTTVRDRIDEATGVTKGADYDADMARMREQYAAQEAAAANVTEVRTRRVDPIQDEFGRPIRFADGSPYGYHIDGAFDVRRFEYDNGTVSQVTIKVALAPKAGVAIDADQLVRLKADVHAGVDAQYNAGKTLANGDRLRVEIEFVTPADAPHLKVELDVKAPGSRADQKHWFIGDDPVVHAHELGHQLGLLDEYVDPAAVRRATAASPGVRTDQSLMGNFWMRGGTVDPGTSLKDRHLAQIGSDIDAARARTGGAGPLPPAAGGAGAVGASAAAPDLDLPPLPELSPDQAARMADLDAEVRELDGGWSALGMHSVEDAQRHFAHFDDPDAAIDELRFLYDERVAVRREGPAGQEDLAGTAWEAQLEGLERPPVVEPAPDAILDLPEYQLAVEDASAKFASLTNIESGKNVAVGPSGHQELSGYGGAGQEATDRVAAAGRASGHEAEPHVFDRPGDAGSYENSHSERKVAEREGGQSFASSKEVCPACQAYFARRAEATGLPQFIGDPSGVRVFMPDGRQLLTPHPSGADTSGAGAAAPSPRAPAAPGSSGSSGGSGAAAWSSTGGAAAARRVLAGRGQAAYRSRKRR